MAQGRFKDVLKNGGFVAFLWTQFLGAFNDNAHRIIGLAARGAHRRAGRSERQVPGTGRRHRAAIPAIHRLRRANWRTPSASASSWRSESYARAGGLEHA